MGLLARERGKSESLLVMSRIEFALLVATLTHVKTGRLPYGHNYERDYGTFKEKKANDNASWCAFQQPNSMETDRLEEMPQGCTEATITYRKGNITVMLLAHPKQRIGLSWLEPCAGKLASTVLRRVGRGDSARLSDKK